ncbi:MAG: dTDP-4-dehydrorhamnose reductase [Paenibacillus sp.]|nr:dTDP-4-dehydrorhamnose reductase [Paenibacillus sp.]
MTRVVLLGANGQLGTDLSRLLAADPDVELVPVLRKDLDVSNIQEIAPYLHKLSPFDVLINCTSYHKTDECEDFAERAFTVNSLAPWEMAKYCASAVSLAASSFGSPSGSGLNAQAPAGTPRFIHFTTDYVFGGCQTEPYIENEPTDPVNVYGASKASGEQLIQAYGKLYFIFRVSSLFGVAGASGKGGNFVETMIRFAREEKEITVVDDQFMSPTHTLDIARAVVALLRSKHSEPGIYHCSGEGACSWFEFAVEIFNRMGISAKLSSGSISTLASKARRPAFSVLDNSKLKPIHQMPHWKDSLDEYIRIKHEGGISAV